MRGVGIPWWHASNSSNSTIQFGCTLDIRFINLDRNRRNDRTHSHTPYPNKYLSIWTPISQTFPFGYLRVQSTQATVPNGTDVCIKYSPLATRSVECMHYTESIHVCGRSAHTCDSNVSVLLSWPQSCVVNSVSAFVIRIHTKVLFFVLSPPPLLKISVVYLDLSTIWARCIAFSIRWIIEYMYRVGIDYCTGCMCASVKFVHSYVIPIVDNDIESSSY